MIGAPSKAIALLLGLQLILAGLAVMPARLVAQRGSVDSLVPAQPVGYVNDFASLIDPARASEMEDLIKRLRGATGAELAVVTLPSIGEHDAAEVALSIGRKWGVGREAEIGDPRRNAGLVLLVVPRQNHKPGTGHVRIETGRGIEGMVT
ncbi:MAG TPA: TPM domain-containing protein, partial [Gemmatimonadales bacterium]|nr:TPM domain-containing protein [Gemmatimonadales bacterium]